MKTKGKVTGIISNIVIVKTEGPVAQNEIATVKLGEVRMMAEVIKVVGDDAYIQVFDSTRGLRMGAEVEFEGHMLEATLGPGILSKNYDGLQNDLADMDGLFIRRGQRTSPLNEETLWEFRPLAKPGDRVEAGDWLGEVKEQWIMHKIMCLSRSRVAIPSAAWPEQESIISTILWPCSKMRRAGNIR